MITYLVTVKQQVIQEHVMTVEIDAKTPEQAKAKARKMLAAGEIMVEHHLSAQGSIRDPVVTDVEALVELDEA